MLTYADVCLCALSARVRLQLRQYLYFCTSKASKLCRTARSVLTRVEHRRRQYLHFFLLVSICTSVLAQALRDASLCALRRCGAGRGLVSICQAMRFSQHIYYASLCALRRCGARRTEGVIICTFVLVKRK